jgi:hypothetical protein
LKSKITITSIQIAKEGFAGNDRAQEVAAAMMLTIAGVAVKFEWRAKIPKGRESSA